MVELRERGISKTILDDLQYSALKDLDFKEEVIKYLAEHVNDKPIELTEKDLEKIKGKKKAVAIEPVQEVIVEQEEQLITPEQLEQEALAFAKQKIAEQEAKEQAKKAQDE